MKILRPIFCVSHVLMVGSHVSSFAPCPIFRTQGHFVRTTNVLSLFSRWVGGGSSPEQQKENTDSSSGVDQVMHSMQSFKANQRLGSMTSGILQELSGARVEGRSEDGKIRVVMNGQQYPVTVQVGDDIDLTTINSSLIQAMQDAHSKSCAVMESKMKSLYDELGLPNSVMKK